MQLHKREAYVVVLASGKTSKTIVVIRSKNGKAVQLYYLLLREGRSISN